MEWNKKNLRYRRPGRRRKKGLGFFASLGAKLDIFFRKLTSKKSVKSAGKKLKRPPSDISEIFDDLKIALPKSRAPKKTDRAREVLAAAARTRIPEDLEPEYARDDFELDDNLEEEYLGAADEPATEIYSEVVFLLDDDAAENTAAAKAAGGAEKRGALRRWLAESGAACAALLTPGRLKRAGAFLLLVIVIGGIWRAAHYFASTVPTARVVKIPLASLPQVDAPPAGLFEGLATRETAVVVTGHTLAEGSTLSQALASVGFSARPEEASAVIDCLSSERGVEVVRPGASVAAYWRDAEKTDLDHLEYYPASGDPPFVVRRGDDGGFWLCNLSAPPLTVTTAAAGVVESTLWGAGSEAGLDPGIIMAMADIMASEIDFLTGVGKGDSFQVLYSRNYLNGRPIGGAKTNAYDAVCVEGLNMKGMSQALNFGKSVADNGWGMFMNMLSYKLAEQGKRLVKIDKWYPSSKRCSACGSVKDELALSERTYRCACGFICDRDINAAINIKHEGLRMLA